MNNMTAYLEKQVINHIFRTASFAKPGALWVALATGVITETIGGDLAGVEVPNAGGYARVQLSPLDANWAAWSVVATSGETQNSLAVTFPAAAAPWGTVSYCAILDSGVYATGNPLFFGPLSVSKTVGTGDQFSFAAGNLQVFLD